MISSNAFRDWKRPIGESGDLSDVIATILSLAAVYHGKNRVPMSEFYSGFAELSKQFPDILSDIHVTRIGGFVQAPELSEALEGAQRIGVGISNPSFQNFLLNLERAQVVLSLIEAREGKNFIEKLRPLADRFVEGSAA